MSTSRPIWLFLLFALATAIPAAAQETTAQEPLPISDVVADEATLLTDEPLAEEPAAEEPAEQEPASDETVVEDTAEEDAADEADADTKTASEEDSAEENIEEKAEEVDTDEEEAVEEDEAAEEEAATDWAGLIERAPVFFSITHHAVIHMPIALWVFGAFFVVVGVVVPSLKNQIPLACLIGGAITSVPAVLSGWWYAQEEWGDDWREFDWTSLRENGWRDLELITQHRWIGVALIGASFLLSIIAIIAYRKENRLLGFIWRVGLIGLALAIAWEGHIGGELIQGEGFLEEAFELWLHPE